jgi:DNA-binding NtrC family response regulator
LLIIGKADSHVALASEIAKTRGAKVTQTSGIEQALSLLRAGKGADMIMVDVMLDIATLITALNTEHISVPVVGYGIDADSEKAAGAIKAGAKEYIPLPPNKELIAALLESIAEESTNFLYKSPTMEKVVKLAKQVAPSDANVLITGESGTGKEVMARYIHEQSKRAKQPFISVNCAAIPDNLLESEMFGHERGAFTGAVSRRVGKFEEADKGTLLLDEISEMEIRLQAKLLRAIQEKVIDRVGGNKPQNVDIRVLATSNRNLKDEVKNGNFREDLFFRLNIIHIEIPPLRDRKEDIPFFAEFFAKKYAASNQVSMMPITDGAFKKMQGYHWPGNVRELENTMHRAILLATEGCIDENAILLSDGDNIQTEDEGEATDTQGFVGRTVDSVEQELIVNTLDHCLGNRTQAATVLGISIRTLRNKLKQYEEASSS